MSELATISDALDRASTNGYHILGNARDIDIVHEALDKQQRELLAATYNYLEGKSYNVEEMEQELFKVRTADSYWVLFCDYMDTWDIIDLTYVSYDDNSVEERGCVALKKYTDDGEEIFIVGVYGGIHEGPEDLSFEFEGLLNDSEDALVDYLFRSHDQLYST